MLGFFGFFLFFFFFKQKTAYEIGQWLEFRRVLFRSARNGTQHKIDAAKTRSAVNGTHQKQLEQFGCRWSELFELEYFDPIRGHSIDPMHCLFLGIAKTVTKHYLTTGLIPKAKIKSLQAAVDMIRVPSSIGRIPRKISWFCEFYCWPMEKLDINLQSVGLERCFTYKTLSNLDDFCQCHQINNQENHKKAGCNSSQTALHKVLPVDWTRIWWSIHNSKLPYALPSSWCHGRLRASLLILVLQLWEVSVAVIFMLPLAKF